MGGRASSEYHRNYYHTRIDKARKVANQNARRKRNVLAVFEYKSSHPCVVCGFSDARALDFHHRDPSQKDFNISNSYTMSMDRLMAEIEKCDVVCRNCHSIIHFEERQGVG